MKSDSAASIKGVLINSHGSEPAERNIRKLLEFFGVGCSIRSRNELFADALATGRAGLFCSLEAFLELVADIESSAETSARWSDSVHSVFLYDGGGPALQSRLARCLDRDETQSPEPSTRTQHCFTVADNPELCGAMAGQQIKATAPCGTLLSSTLQQRARNILSFAADAACVFGKYKGVPLFVSAASEIVDLDTELPRGTFDIREHVTTALPIILYIKWAFATMCWQPAETGACLMIDDPLLKRSHGFVDFVALLSLMKRHHFSTNIAFIPWNWRRSADSVVDLFVRNHDHYSLSIHGCNHTRGEFGRANAYLLASKTQEAVARMVAHEKHTGISYDPVMVFPQGVFCAAAMDVLKRSGLVAAVNNETITDDVRALPIFIRDVWDVALMKYNQFPVFTRRYPWEGIENFAFDALLGKPAISIIHHDACSDGCQRLVEFIDRLNASHIRPVWRSLGEVLRRSYRQRRLGESGFEMQAYATETRLVNDMTQDAEFRFTRQESEPDAIQSVLTNATKVPWKAADGSICFTVRLKPGESMLIRVCFHEPSPLRAEPKSAWNEARVMVRRYLCEVRDNYVSKAKLMANSALHRTDPKWN